jgi:flagellar hook-associated protein 3 FlgL
MRMTFDSANRETQASLERAADRLMQLNRQVATGRRLNTASDDPSGAATAVTERSQIMAIEQFVRAADALNARLAVADDVLGVVVDRVSAARVAVHASRSSTATASQREAYAREIESIRATLLGSFTTKVHGVYLFSGSESTTAPYTANPDGTVSAYQGDDTAVLVDIDRQVAVRSTFSADEIARGTDTDDVFTVLTDLAAAIRADDSTGMADGMAALDRAFDRAVAAQARVGTDMKAIEDHRGRLAALKDASTARVSKVEDANMAEAIAGLTQADTAYRAALGAAGMARQLSLMDFLR